jgi:hypothetical protein
MRPALDLLRFFFSFIRVFSVASKTIALLAEIDPNPLFIWLLGDDRER